MKRLGILYSKNNKKLFLLPNEIKTLTQKGVSITILSGAGMCININDNELQNAGAKIVNDWHEVINNSDIILKVEAFNESEIKAIGTKTAITMVNYLINVDMFYFMLQNKTTALEWNALSNKGNYLFFPEFEEAKAPYILKFLQDAFAKGLAKRQKDKVIYPKNPKLLILNATFNSVSLAKLAIKAGFIVTIADNDSQYLQQLKQSQDLSSLITTDANYETLVALIKKQNAFVTTALNPIDVAHTRITKNMAETMPNGSLLIDAGCEYGYGFQFVKKYVDKELKWNKIGNSFFLAHEDLTNLFAKKYSEIISSKSVDYLFDLVSDNNKNIFDKITICKDSKVVSPFINAKLRLY